MKETAKRIITEQMKTRHISLNQLANRISMSTATLQKRLEEPESFSIRDINFICIVLRLNDEERAVLTCDNNYMDLKKSLEKEL